MLKRKIRHAAATVQGIDSEISFATYEAQQGKYSLRLTARYIEGTSGVYYAYAFMYDGHVLQAVNGSAMNDLPDDVAAEILKQEIAETRYGFAEEEIKIGGTA